MALSTTVIKTPHVYTKTVGSVLYQPPITDALVGAYAFGQSDDYCRTNLGGSGGAAAKIGTLTHSTWYSTFGPSGYIDTQQPEAASFTYFAVVRRQDVGAFIMGTINGGVVNPFAGLYINTATPKKFQGRMTWSNDGGTTHYTQAFPQSANPAAGGDWIAVALTCSEASNRVRLHLPREGEVSSYLLYTGIRKLSALTVTIGGAAAPSTPFSNTIAMAGAEFHARELSVAEVGLVWQARKKFHVQRAIGI